MRVPKCQPFSITWEHRIRTSSFVFRRFARVIHGKMEFWTSIFVFGFSTTTKTKSELLFAFRNWNFHIGFFFLQHWKRNWNFPWLRTTELQLLFPMRVHSCTLVPTVFLRHEKTAFKFNGIQTYFFRFPSTLKTKLELLLSFFVNPLICTTELQLSFPFFIICFHMALKNEICTSSFVSCFCVLLW